LSELRLKLLAVSASAFLSLVLLEVAVRIVFAFFVGIDVLGYGLWSATRTTVHLHDNIVVGRYSKYAPNEVKRDRENGTGRFIDVHINSRGFRGPEFSIEKSPGVFRIVTLGASSTFGYHATDDQTYPQHLQRELTARCVNRGIEVINLGIPHLDAEQILALFLAEALPLAPDVVTFYEGANDAQGGSWRAPLVPSIRVRITNWLRDHVLLFKLILQLRHREAMYDAQAYAAFAEGKPERFLMSLEKLRIILADRGIHLLAITQQANGGGANDVPYEDEERRLRAALIESKSINVGQATFLVHADITRALREWAAEKEVPLVDGIAALNRYRNLMTSWVHLSGPANDMLARAIATRIAPLACKPAH
jgi:hypothetical protein